LVTASSLHCRSCHSFVCLSDVCKHDFCNKAFSDFDEARGVSWHYSLCVRNIKPLKTQPLHIPVKFNKAGVLGHFAKLVSLAFANERISRKFARIARAATYAEIFWTVNFRYRVKNVGRHRFGRGAPTSYPDSYFDLTLLARCRHRLHTPDRHKIVPRRLYRLFNSFHSKTHSIHKHILKMCLVYTPCPKRVPLIFLL